jgi:hypothetical protein
MPSWFWEPLGTRPAAPGVADDHSEQGGDAQAGDEEGFIAAQPVSDGSCRPGGYPGDGEDERQAADETCHGDSDRFHSSLHAASPNMAVMTG